MQVYCQILEAQIREKDCLAEQERFRKEYPTGIPSTPSGKILSCYGCKESSRKCIQCFQHPILDVQRGLCGACIFENEGMEYARQKLIKKIGQLTVFCLASNKNIAGTTCLEMQGALYCKKCMASSRLCENCKTHVVESGETGLCAKCTRANLNVRQTVQSSSKKYCA